MRGYVKIPSLGGVEAFRAHVRSLGLELPCDDAIMTAPASPLAQPCEVGAFVVGNRWCIHPMEGWDGSADGRPTEAVRRRWRRFGESGAKLIWGGEAVAVRMDARANPNQLVINEANLPDLAALLAELRAAHRAAFGSDDDLLVGLQLTHSGRFCRPFRNDRAEPKIVYHHPILDRRFGIPPDYPILTDGEIRAIIDDFVRAARLAARAGFQFVDLKHCHGYLGHEFLSAVHRPGPYGGSFENRTRFLREIVGGIRAEAPELMLGVRLSAFDLVPFRPDPARSEGGRLGPGIPEPLADSLPYEAAFGADPTDPTRPDLRPAIEFLALLERLGIHFVNVTAGSPYYNPHIQRPACYPPSDGYQPPEDPLVGVARQIAATAELRRRFPRMQLVGSAYTYLQEYLPHVAQAVVRAGWVDFVGIGRMALPYPDLIRDTLERGVLDPKRICRTFSDCTTAPRNGLPSGCYPLDPYYRQSPQRQQLIELKAARERQFRA